MRKSVCSILIVDDDPDDIFLVKAAIADIEKSSYEVSAARSATEAIGRLSRCNFDLIISDHRLGPMTGIELLKEIRARGIDTPVILMTGMSDHSIEEEALKAGASDYISKSALSSAIIDRAIRYAITNACRQDLVSSVISNVKAAICVVDEEENPEVWSSEFLALARNEYADPREEVAVRALAGAVISTNQNYTFAGQTHKKKITVLPDNRTIIMLHDVTEHTTAPREWEQEQSESAYQAMHCFLTGLPNRFAFGAKLEQLIAEQTEFDLLTIDLNKFKAVNDVFGHPVGDKLLQRVSVALRECCQEDDFLARTGGDEFVAIHTTGNGCQCKGDLAENFLAALDRSFVIDGRKIRVGACIGIASFPANGVDSDSLLSNADFAMYRVKSVSGCGIQIYDSEMDRAAREERRLTRDLQFAIRNDKLEVHFQPQFDLETGMLVGCEALARWIHPTDGAISPYVFIKLAEESGLIEELGTVILRKACSIATSWPVPIRVAVNISGVQVRHTDLVANVRSILFETGLSAKRLELEVTETVLLEDLDHALHVLRGIKNLGVHLAMDDFGTGFSSLSSLISFPFDKLKIDRSFVSDMENREQLKLVIKTCAVLGRNLNLRVVAEGIEKQCHIDFLRSVECDEIQGHFLGKPMPSAAFLEFMRLNSTLPSYEREIPNLKVCAG